MEKVLKHQEKETSLDADLITLSSINDKPILIFDVNTRIIDCNEAFISYSGLSRNEVIASKPLEKVRQSQFFNAFKEALDNKISTFNGHLQVDGKLKNFYLQSVFFLTNIDAEAEKKIFCCIIEENRLNKLKVSDHYNYKIDNDFNKFLNTVVSLHDMQGGIIYLSPSVEELLGFTSTEIREFKDLDIVYHEDRQKVLDSIELLRDGTESRVVSYRLIHKNGTIINVQTSCYVIGNSIDSKHLIVALTLNSGSHADMQQVLELSEQKYYQLAMNLPSGVSLISASGELLEANDAMKRIIGISDGTPLPSFNFFTHEKMVQEGISDLLKRCIHEKVIINGDLSIKSGRTSQDVFLSYSFLPIVYRDGNVDKVIGYVNDLSDQKRVEIVSRERAEFLDLVVNAIKSPFFVKDEEHKWVMLNDAAVSMMGTSRDSLIGKSDYDLYPKSQADIFWKYDEMVFENGSSVNEEQITWSDGTIHNIVTHKQLYVEKPTGKKFIVGTIHDISSYKKIEEELRASEYKYRELFDNANDFIITTDLDGKITNANRTLLNHLQTDLESIIKLNVYDFVRDENGIAVADLKNKVFNGLLDDPFEINASTSEGAQVTYEVKVSRITENNFLIGFQCVFSDITERKESRLKLEKYNKNLIELNKTKDKFFSIIAHDLRNPYSSLIGFSELLLEDLEKLSKDEIRDYLKIIRNSAKNSLNLLENLLAWSRLETGRMPFDPAKVVLNDVVDEVVNVLFSLAYRKKIEIDNQVEHNVFLLADKNMMNTILNNLVMNAIKFTPIGGRITVFAEELYPETNDGKVFIKISVADTGVGIESEIAESLFNSQKPVSSEGTEKEQGTGLGLLLSREMVDRHGGKIQVKSTPGKGSVFSFTIPMLVQ